MSYFKVYGDIFPKSDETVYFLQLWQNNITFFIILVYYSDFQIAEMCEQTFFIYLKQCRLQEQNKGG